jgi:hypothetical protein
MIYAPPELTELAEFCYKELNLGKKVGVDIHYEKLDVDGWCVDGDELYDIEINESLSLTDKMITLCHEMVHVRQYSTGQKVSEEEAYDLEGKLYGIFV